MATRALGRASNTVPLLRDVRGEARLALMAVTPPGSAYLRAARDSARESALTVYAAARASTGRATFTLWGDVCAGCDRLQPGFSGSHTHEGTGLELARLTPTTLCTACGAEMVRVGVVACHFATAALPPRAALARLLADHERRLRAAPLFRLARIDLTLDISAKHSP